MRKRELDNLRDQVRADYQERIRKLETELTRLRALMEGELRALDRIHSPAEASPLARTNAIDRSLSMLREVIEATSSAFTSKEIEESLRTQYGELAPSRSRILRGLRELTDRSVILCVTEGRGRRPARYKYVGSGEEESNEDNQAEEN